MRSMRIFPYLLIFASTTTCAQAVKAELQCRLTRVDYVYDCAIRLARDGRPLAGAEVMLGADMPSMPKAHAVKPVKAMPGKAPGEYRANVDLEMLGEWAVTLHLAGPVKDRLILLYDFDEKGARPVRRAGRPLRK